MTLLPLTKGEVPYRLNVDFELIALSSVADMVLQTYALGKLFGKWLRCIRMHTKRLIKHHSSFDGTGIGITTLSTKQKTEEVVGIEPTACFTTQRCGPLPRGVSLVRVLLLYQLSYTSCFCNGGTLTLNLPLTKQDSSHLSYIAY